ncbi:MAG: hypothetical protein RLZZ241_323 [Bacteroidota bacterium]|jgi:hypothetical protein
MKMKFSLLILSVLLIGCFAPERNCEQFKEGSFEFTSLVGTKEETSIFTRKGNLEISVYKGVTDSASVRWINSCEYILTTINPKNPNQKKPLHFKILATSADSYTFEYKIVGTSVAQRGTAIKIP